MHALLLCAALAGATDQDFVLKVGEPAPPFSMRDLDKQMFTLGNLVGPEPTTPKKAVLMVFFATWCQPCKKEIPIIKDLHKRWSKAGVEVVYVGQSQGPADLGPFAKAQAMPWRVVPDSFGLVSRRYGATALPHVLIIGADGNLSFQHRGIADNIGQTLDAELARITGQKAAAPGPGSGSVDKPRFATTYKLGRVPSGEGAGARWQPLATVLGEEVSANIAVESEGTYESFAKVLGAGGFDLANAGPLLCYDVRDKYEPLVRLERQGTPTYNGIIFALRKSGFAKVTDLKGKRIALVAKSSTSGGLYQLKALLDAGLVPGKDIEVAWLGSHDAVAQAVKDGKVDAGGCYEDCRDAAWKLPAAKAATTRVLGYTAEIPGELVVVKKSLDAKVKDGLRRALLAASGNQGLLTQLSEGELPVTAIVEATPKDLEGLALVVEAVKQNRLPQH